MKAFRCRTDAVRAGTVLKADGGFTCLKEGDERVVHQDSKGCRYIDCGGLGERHYLDGQLSDDGKHYIGLEIVR